MSAEGVKAEGEGKEAITIRVKDQTGEETVFKVKKTTKMDKIFHTYAERKGVNAGSLRFFLDGNRINGTDTPGSLDLQNEDQIDCMLEQQGGSL